MDNRDSLANASDWMLQRLIDHQHPADAQALLETQAAEIAVRAAEALNAVVDAFGPDAITWIRDALLQSTRSFTDAHGDTWVETQPGELSMLDAPAGMLQDWSYESVESLFGPLLQQSGDPLPVVHATSRWQRVLGRLGVAARAWCGERIVASPVSGLSRECRECRRALDGER